ncbi:hypothetical protein NKG94_15375 [Micromonospora sp. M12]
MGVLGHRLPQVRQLRRHQGRSGQQRYTAMRDALARTGRPILFAICNWGNDDVGSWGRPPATPGVPPATSPATGVR